MTRRRRCRTCNKLFEPTFDKGKVQQLVCSHICCAEYYDKQKPKSRKLATTVAKMVGKRSMGEVKFYAYNIEANKTITAVYEPDSFQFNVEETRTYTPDFRVLLPSGRKWFVLEINTRLLTYGLYFRKPVIRFVKDRKLPMVTGLRRTVLNGPTTKSRKDG